MLGYTLAIFTGLTLGLLGGGGSVLTVPILVYVFKIDPKTAIALSLAIVGISALVAAYKYYHQKSIAIKQALFFILTATPGTLFGSYLSQFFSGNTQLIFFAFIMIQASIFMIRGTTTHVSKVNDSRKWHLALSGFGVGIITGLVGVGGGFLIVPSLIYFNGLQTKKAIGSSLFIIVINSAIGFISYINIVEIPWLTLLNFTIFTIIGIFIGVSLSNRVPQHLLKKIFGIFLILVSFFILYMDLT